MWVEFIVSLPSFETFFSGYSSPVTCCIAVVFSKVPLEEYTLLSEARTRRNLLRAASDIDSNCSVSTMINKLYLVDTS